MKRLILLAFLTTAIVAAVTSCSKKDCYQCTTTITETIQGRDPQVLSTASQDYCGIDDDRARDIENAAYQSHVRKEGDLTITRVTATVCK